MLTTLTFLGHSAVMLETERYVVAIDPWLEGNPSCPKELKNPQKLNLIVLTHGHSDHASDTARLVRETTASVMASYELCGVLKTQGVPEDHLLPMNKGGTREHLGLSISLTHAQHSSSYDTDKGPVYCGEACGVVVSDGKRTIYHAGDTSLFSDMKLIRELYAPDIALLPIGDIFTMNPKHAAMAAEFLGVKSAIPIHYKTFEMLTGTSAEFEAECKKRKIQSVVLEPGGKIKI